MDLTHNFFLNNKIHIPSFKKNNIQSTFNTNFDKNYDINFSSKSTFIDNSDKTINNSNVFNKTFNEKSNFKNDPDHNELVDVTNMPNFKMKDFNAQYRYRYPKMSKDEYILSQWQTESGTSNELNQVMRSEINNESIEDIKEGDNIYQQGLQKLKSDLKAKHITSSQKINEIDNDTTLTPIQKRVKKFPYKKAIFTGERDFKEYTKKNPVVIRPAIIAPAPVPQPPRPQPQPVPQPAPAPAPAPQPLIMQKAPTDSDLEKVTNSLRQVVAKKKLEKLKEEAKRNSINPSDAQTVIDNTTPKIETYKINQQSYKQLLNKYISLDENDTLDSFDNEDKIKIKGFMKVLGISPNTKILKSLRKKL